MPRYISANPSDIITFTSDNGDKWEGELVYDPGYEFSCDYCGTEMEDAVGGYWKDDVRHCAHCAWDLFDQPEPITAYKIWRQEKDERERMEEEDIASAGPKEHDPMYDFDSFKPNELWDPNPNFDVDRTLSREYYHVQDDQVQTNDPLPSTKEELFEYLEAHFEQVSIVPDDAIKLDEDFIYCETYDEAIDLINKAAYDEDDISQLLPDDSYSVSQQHGRFWYVLRPVQNNPTKFSISVFARKDEIATKYLIRQLEECIYRIDYISDPELAIRESGQGFSPIVSAICMFQEISMSNILFASLVDLTQYFV